MVIYVLDVIDPRQLYLLPFKLILISSFQPAFEMLVVSIILMISLLIFRYILNPILILFYFRFLTLNLATIMAALQLVNRCI